MLTEVQQQVLDGALLGDGNLSCRYKNAELRYISKYEEHVKFISNYFKNYLTLKSLTSKTIIHPKTNNPYTSYKLRTKQCKDWTPQYYRWYGQNNHKEIPQDLIITPLICLIWYIGDGTLSKGKRQGQEIKLCTNSFNKQKLENILIPQMKGFEAYLRHVEKDSYHIIIPRRKIKQFLTYIGDCPIQDYKYKWSYEEYKNKMSNKNYKQYEQRLITMYNSGTTYYKVAKYFNMDPSLVRHYLKKHGIIK